MPNKIEESLISIDDRMSRLMPILPLFGLSMGFFLPGLFINFISWIPVFMAFITFTGAMRLRIVEFGAVIRNPFHIIIFFVFVRILMPLFAMFASSIIFSGEPNTITGFVLIYSAPTAVTGFIWVSLFRGDKALCLSLILLDTILSPLVIPGTVSLLRGTEVTINAGGIMVSLVYMVLIPTIVGVTLNETSRGKVPARLFPYFNPLSKTAMILIVASNASLTMPSIRFNDTKVWTLIAMSIFILAMGILLSRIVCFFLRIGFDKSVAITIPSGQRNTTVAITIAIGFFPEAVALPGLISILFQQIVTGLLGNLLFRKGTA